MLKDITFGQYIFGSSPVHRLDPRTKIAITVLYIAMLFTAKNFIGMAICAAFSFLLYFIAKIPVKMILRSLKPIIPIVVFTAVINLFFVDGDPVFGFWKITITKQGIFYSLILVIRIVCLISSSSILTYTTSPIELTDAIERILLPLKFLKLPVHELAMMMTIAMRFIPTLIEETDKIMSAQKSRGADLENGKLTQRVKALVPILVPLFISSFRRADELALAMECRCYHGGEGRTRMKQLKYTKLDAFASAFFIVIFGVVIACNSLFTAVV